jgi:hypothetical protein
METGVLVCFFKPTRSRVGRPNALHSDLKHGRNLAEGLLTRPLLSSPPGFRVN